MRKFLLVSDEAEYRRFVRDYISETEYGVTIVEDGEKALNIISEELFEFTVISAELAEAKDWQLVRTIHEAHNDMWIALVMDAYDEQNSERDDKLCKECGVVGKIYLKYTVDAFKSNISYLFRKSRHLGRREA